MLACLTLVCLPFVSCLLANPGAVYVYELSLYGYSLLANLSIGEMYSYMQFGASVSFNHNGTLLAVGAPLDDDYLGLVYLFKRQGSKFEKVYLLRDMEATSAYSYFGQSMDMSDDGSSGK